MPDECPSAATIQAAPPAPSPLRSRDVGVLDLEQAPRAARWQIDRVKSHIIEELGQAEILLPSLVTAGLAANDRAKVRMAALQAAADHALEPAGAPASLEADSRAAGLDPVAIAALVRNARLSANARVAAPELAALGEALLADLADMAGAVAAGAPAEGAAAQARLAAIRAEHFAAPWEEIAPERIARLVGLPQAGGDSLHRLVMDLHKALNRLAAGCAEEEIAGARAFGLGAEDRPAVEAFMRGLNRTRPLKFDHPGLDTTATRSGARLAIENDIGTTDAHVVVTTLEGNAVSVIYTDVHRARARFFTGLLADDGVAWSGLEKRKAAGLAEDAAFYLVHGRYESGERRELHAFLERVGAALVFLIDWNKARKLLRGLVPKRDAVRILEWAARNRVGHRAFLQLGGGELIGSAVRHAAASRIGFGERLDDALGRDAAEAFLQSVLRASTEALLGSGSVRTVRDRVEAELVRHLERVDSALLAIVVRQAGLAREVIADIARHLAGLRAGLGGDAAARAGRALAERARRVEEKADKIALEARGEVARFNADPLIEALVDRAEDAIDQLEQAAFLASLLPDGVEPAALAPLAELAAAGVAAAEAAAVGVDAAAEVPRGRRDDAEDALAAVNRLIECEHRADDCERAVAALALGGKLDLARALSALELARAIERATDLLAGLGHLVRRHVLADLAA